MTPPTKAERCARCGKPYQSQIHDKAGHLQADGTFIASYQEMNPETGRFVNPHWFVPPKEAEP